MKAYLFILIFSFALTSCKSNRKQNHLIAYKFYLEDVNKYIEFQNGYKFSEIVLNKEGMRWGATELIGKYCLLDSMKNKVLCFDIYKNTYKDSINFLENSKNITFYQTKFQEYQKNHFDNEIKGYYNDSIFYFKTDEGDLVAKKEWLKKELTIKDLPFLIGRQKVFFEIKNIIIFNTGLYTNDNLIFINFRKNITTINSKLTDVEILNILKDFVNSVRIY